MFAFRGGIYFNNKNNIVNLYYIIMLLSIYNIIRNAYMKNL